MKAEVARALDALRVHYEETLKNVHMRDLFDADPDRFNRFSVEWKENSLLFDYSKNIITTDTLPLLMDVCKAAKLSEAIEQMFRGEKMNARCLA